MEDINNISINQLKKSVLLSQIIILIVALLSVYFFIGFNKMYSQFISLNVVELAVYGFGSGLLLVILNIGLNYVLPEESFDDGGFNKLFFSSLSYSEILLFCLLIAVSEELLFRGVIQTKFGIMISTIVFTLVHFRYLKKFILFFVVLIESFVLGYLFLKTQNLLVVILSHFLLDAILGSYLKYSQHDKQDWNEIKNE
ncbi:CPBP family intramembrane metalloprotease [Bacillus sp. RG28]|uniref:CPBP family intramembrane metalloprotease n=1 Tax=Gottfriedia endophytica TaxID=2820819 RepID=A0A940SHR9_9BACI|nr:type II CAAX endopeptidase family protein [Gottfriedia endophytica]MBP0724235.1 CPBP family intramembrane metalloprotease [Gottfriedia endophytica]